MHVSILFSTRSSRVSRSKGSLLKLFWYNIKNTFFVKIVLIYFKEKHIYNVYKRKSLSFSSNLSYWVYTCHWQSCLWSCWEEYVWGRVWIKVISLGLYFFSFSDLLFFNPFFLSIANNPCLSFFFSAMRLL